MKAPENSQQVLFGGTFVLANKLQAVGDKAVAGLSTKQWFLLRNLMEMPLDPPPTITQVAHEIDSTRQNVTKMLEVMEREGLVVLEKSKDDQRSRSVQMTPEGLARAKQTAGNAQAFLEKLFAGIEAEDQKVAALVLIKMIQNLEEIQRQG